MTKVINHTEKDAVNMVNNAKVRSLSKWIRSDGAEKYRDNDTNGLTTANNETLVPEQIISSAQDLTKNRFSFRPYLNYQPVKSSKGDFPILSEDAYAKSKDELSHYTDSDSDIKTIPFKITTYASRIVLSQELLMDADFPITPLVSKQLGVLINNTVNKLTTDKLKTLPATNISSLTDLIQNINAVDPRWAKYIFIGQSAWGKLLSLTDKNNDYYLLNNTKSFMGLPIIIIPNYLGMSNECFVGNPSVALTMFSRMQTTLQFANNNIWGQSLAAIIRADIEFTNPDALKHLTFGGGNATPKSN